MKKKISCIMILALIISIINIAGAASEVKSWTATCINRSGVPSGTGQQPYVYMQASSETYTGTVSTVSNVAKKTTTISCLSHNMSLIGASGNNAVISGLGSQDWTISGSLIPVTYKVVFTSTATGTTSASGTISR